MSRLLILLFAVFAVAWSMPTVSLKSNSQPFQEFLVTAHNDDPYCDHGTMIDKYDIGAPDEACPHAIRHLMVTDMRRVSFAWKAPRCGCVTFRATLKTDEHVYSESSFEKGSLIKQVCVTGMNKQDERDMTEEPVLVEEEEPSVEEPFYDEELYDNIEQLCEEGNVRGSVLPAVVRECCQLPVHERRQCLVRVIPGEENDLHRLDTFCSKMVGGFFEGHPVLATAEGVRRCCDLTSDMDRTVCLAEEKKVHYDEICGLRRVEVNNTVEDRVPGRNCCNLTGDLRYNCMDRKALLENQKRRLEGRRSMRRKVEKVKRLCNAVDQTPEGDRDSEDYQTCCTVEDVDDVMMCFRELARNNFDGLCKKQAMRYKNGKKGRIHPCCSRESDARYECFSKKRSNNQQSRLNLTNGSTDRSSDLNRPTWMQRTCARLRSEGADETLIFCCQLPTFPEKKSCMDDWQNYFLAQGCNASNEDVSNAINESDNFNAAKRILNPEHECCILDGEERIACIKTMRMSISKLRRQDSSEKQVLVEALREQKEPRWMKEESRQNEAICAIVRKDVDRVDEQVVRCCEKDDESQRECLAVLRRKHFTAVCKTEALFHIDIFNTVLRTEDPINNEHRCCMRPNADIRAACFSRVVRKVAMLSYSPPVIEEVQEIRTDLLGVAEFNRIDSVCQETTTATSYELRGRWPVKKCCRYKNNRKYTCLMDTAKRLADQSCDGPPPRVYFPVGFYGEYIPSDYAGPFLDPSHPCCSLTSDMRQECIKDASMAVLALRLPIIEVKPLVEFFKDMPSEMRFDINHQDAICQAAEDFQNFYADLENGLDVELSQPSVIQRELQELQDLLWEELTEEEEEQREQLAEQNEEQAELLAEQEEERLEMLEEQAQQLVEQNQQSGKEEEEDDRRRKRRQADKFRRPTTQKVRASAGRSIYEVDSLVYCCQENSVTETKTCMTTLWLQLLNEACAALPDLPTYSPAMSTEFESASESAQGNNLFAPAPLKSGGRGDIQTFAANSVSTLESTVELNSDEENFRRCCSLSGEAQLECFQTHYSPAAPSSLMESEGSAIPSTVGSESEGSVSESEGQESEGSESERQESEGSESEDSEGEEPEESEGEQEPQDQMETEGKEPESEEDDDSGEVLEGSKSGSSAGPGSVPLGLTESEGQTADGEQPAELEESQDPQEQMESEGQQSESEGEEPEIEDPEESKGGQEPQEAMESEGQEIESEGEEVEESEGEQEPQEQSGSEGQESESEGEVPKESEGGQEPQEKMEIEGQEVESEGEEPETEEPEESEEVQGPQGQKTEEKTGGWWNWWSGGKNPQNQEQSLGEEVEEEEEEDDDSGEVSEGSESGSSAGPGSVPLGLTESEGQTADGEEPVELEESKDPQEQMESEGQQSELEGEEPETEDPEESKGGQEPKEVMESEGQEVEFEGEEVEEFEGEQLPQEQIGSEGQESESEGEDPEESEGRQEQQEMMESEGQEVESEGEEPEESDGVQGSQGQKTQEQTGGWWKWSGGKNPQNQEQSLGEEAEEEEEEDDDSGEVSEGSESGSSAGPGSVPLGLTDSEGQTADGEEPAELEESQDPQEQMESEGQQSESEGEEPEAEHPEESKGGQEPQEAMESEGQEVQSEGEGVEESEGEQEPQEQSGSEGQESESEGEVPEEYEGGQEPQEKMEIEGQEVESEGEEPETEEPEESEGVQGPQGKKTQEKTGRWWNWWSGGKNPQNQEQSLGEEVEEEEEEDDDYGEVSEGSESGSSAEPGSVPLGLTEGEGQTADGEEPAELEESQDPQEQMESEGQQSESEGEEPEAEDPEESKGGQEPQEAMESEGQEVQSEGEEVEESEGEQEPQEQSRSEGQESELEGEDPEESEGGQEPQEMMENEGQEVESEGEEPEESEGVQGPQGQKTQEKTGRWWNWWSGGNEPKTQEQHGGEEGEEEEGEDSRRKRDIWSAMELLNDIQDKHNYMVKQGRPSKNHQESTRHNHREGSTKHRPGRIFGKMSLLKLLLKNDLVKSVCPTVKAGDNIQSAIASLSQMAQTEGGHKKRDRSRGSDAMLLELKECCALNITDDTVECIATMTQTLVDGICDIQDGGFRPRPSHASQFTKGDAWAKKRFLRGCCNETGEERYSCARSYLVPESEIEEIAETIAERDSEETDPLDLFRSVGKAVGKLLTLANQGDEEHSEVIDQETTTTTPSTPVDVMSWNNMRGSLITKMCCKVGSMTGALIGESGGVTCEGGAKVYSKLVEESMRGKCFTAYTKCCSRPEE